MWQRTPRRPQAVQRKRAPPRPPIGIAALPQPASAGHPAAAAKLERQAHPADPGDDQEFNFAGPYSENGFLEDYTARVRGEQLGNVVLVTRNAAGQAQHVVANYRPRNALLLVSRLIGEHFAGTPYGEHYASSAPE